VIDALLASGPPPELTDELDLYGRLVGEWDFDYSNESARTRGEWLFFWALDGWAVADVWICPARDVTVLPGPREHGLTVRFRDRELGVWRVVWNGPQYGALQTFLARERDGEIVQDGTRANGQRLQWIFSNITDESFDWRSQELHGDEWRIRERIAAKRR